VRPGRRLQRDPPASAGVGVLELKIPVSEKTKPRKISIGSGNSGRRQIKG
jgi:HSP20 family protein